MTPWFEIRVAAGGDDVDAADDVIVAAEIVEQVGADRPSWTQLVVRTIDGPDHVSAAPAGDIAVAGTLLERPQGPSPVDPGWTMLLFHICEVPDPDHVEAWLRRSQEITAGMPLAPLAWFELDERQRTPDNPWGEVHLTAVRDVFAVEDLLGHPLWEPSQPLLERAVGRHHQLVTRPIVNRLFDSG